MTVTDHADEFINHCEFYVYWVMRIFKVYITVVKREKKWPGAGDAV